jgi:hypothetical protein
MQLVPWRSPIMGKRNKGRLPPFVPLIKGTLKTPAWKALSHGARSLYAALAEKYSTHLEGAVYLSHRRAQETLGSHSSRDSIARWFRELEHYGFIHKVSLAHHGLNGHGRAPHYRLTEHSYLNQAATRDYLNWDGVIFHGQKSPSPYLEKIRSRGLDGGATLAGTGVPVAEQSEPQTEKTGLDGGAMSEKDGGLDGDTISSQPLPTLDDLDIPPFLDRRGVQSDQSQSNPKPVQFKNYAEAALHTLGGGSRFVSRWEKNGDTPTR